MATSSISSSAPTPSPKPGGTSVLRRVFKAFEYRDFRIMWLGACTSTIGTFMQTLAQAWLVLEISKSAFYLGLDAFLSQIPIVLFSLIGGVVADRKERRNLLMFSQVIQMTCAFTLATLFATHVVHIWHILMLSFFTGFAQSFGGPAYSALIPSLVKKEDVPNAIALNSIQFNLARIIGPMLGGIALTQFGAAWCFLLNGLSFVAVIISLLMMHTRFVPAKTGESMVTSLKQGFHFILKQPAMESLIVLAFLMTVLAIPLIVFLPVFARSVFRGTADLYTLFLCCSGGGAVSGALLVAYMGHFKHKGRGALIMLAAMGALMFFFARSHSVVLSCVMIFLAGSAMMAAMSTISSLVQLITTDQMRGRVMSVFNVAFRGGMPVGSLLAGSLIPKFTAPVVLAWNGVLLVVLGLYFLLGHKKIAEL
jgi:predicted MFS family arabinose efflux permease